MNKSPEKKVQGACIKRLEVWELRRVVIHFDNLADAGRKFNPYSGVWVMHTKKGRPDLVAYINHNGLCWVYFMEIKNPDGGIWGKDQKQYAAKFDDLSNVVYEVVTNPNQVDRTIEIITNHQQNILDNISL